MEGGDAAVLVHGHDAKLSGGFLDGHLDTADRHVGLFLDVGRQQRAVIHLVDVIAGQDQTIARRVRANNVDDSGIPRRPCRDTTLR